MSTPGTAGQAGRSAQIREFLQGPHGDFISGCPRPVQVSFEVRVHGDNSRHRRSSAETAIRQRFLRRWPEQRVYQLFQVALVLLSDCVVSVKCSYRWSYP